MQSLLHKIVDANFIVLEALLTEIFENLNFEPKKPYWKFNFYLLKKELSSPPNK